MGVTDGTAVSAAITNPAFLDADQNDTGIGIYTLANTDVASGAQIDNIQREINSIVNFSGSDPGQAYNYVPTYSNNNGFINNEKLKNRADSLSAKFDQTSGHMHSGAAGDAPPVPSVNVSNVVLSGSLVSGTLITGVTGGSTDVSSYMTGLVNSTGSAVKGVVVTAPYNKIPLRDTNNDVIKNGTGDEIYARLTWSASVWTLIYYYLSGGTETSYSFGSSTSLNWFYQRLYNPITDKPVYNDSLYVPSDNATADVVDASATQRGLVSTGTQSLAGNKTFTGTIQNDTLTASRAVVSDASKILVSSAATSTEVGYLSGVTSAIQTQINAKADDSSVVHISGTETVTGQKTFSATLIATAALRADYVVNSASTGANVELPQPSKIIVKVTNASLTSINAIASPAASQVLILINGTGAAVTIKNNTASTPANGILTGTGLDLSLANAASLWLAYDPDSSRWRIIGGSGAGGGASTITAVSGNYSILLTDSVLLVTCSSADLTLTLPTPTSGQMFYVKKLDSSIYKVIVSKNASETIDGRSTIEIYNQYDSIQLVSNGTNWFLL
jgi:hypothetical protein